FLNDNDHTIDIPTDSNYTSSDTVKSNMKIIHTQIVTEYTKLLPENKILGHQAPEIRHSEELLSRKTRCTLSQLRTNKSPFLLSYKHKINPTLYPSPLCPLCKNDEHNTSHTYSTAHTYQLHSHPWICGMPLAGLRSCLKRGRRRWRLSRDEGSGESTLRRMGSGSTTTTTTLISTYRSMKRTDDTNIDVQINEEN